MGDWWILRSIFGGLDRVIYAFMINVYKLMMQIANQEIFSEDLISKFSTRIYTLLGIFMGLRLIFSFINYVVNPDSMTEAKTGGKKLVINIIVSLVLLIALPSFVFPEARKLQKNILEDHILEKLILGIKGDIYSSSGANDDDSESKNIKRDARMTSYLVFTSFFYPAPCKDIGTTFYRDSSNDIENDFESQDKNGKNYRYKLNGECAEAIVNSVKDNKKEQAYNAILQYEKAYNQYQIDWLLDEYEDGDDLKDLKDKNGDRLFEYTFLISTAVGIGVTWMFFTFCFQFAVRSIKLAFLELIAPIPILSYIDPKRDKVLSQWIKMYLNTFADLFIRLAGVYFAVFSISVITTEGFNVKGGPLVNLFIIIGALMFANQLPKLVDDIFGTHLSSAKFSLNPLKNSPIANAVVGGAVGAAGAGLVSAAGNMHASYKEREELRKRMLLPSDDPNYLSNSELSARQRLLVNDNKMAQGLAGFGAAASGLGGGIGRGVVGGLKGKGTSSYGKILSNAAAATGTSRNLRRESSYRTKDRIADKYTDLTKVNYKTGTADAISDKVKKYQRAVGDSKQSEERIKQMQSANMQAALSKIKYDSEGNKIENKLRPGEFNRINGYVDRDSLEQVVKFGDLTVDWDKLKDKNYKDQVYAAYKDDAMGRGLKDGEYLDESEFDSAFGLVADFHEQDRATKDFEKALKSATESKTAREKKGN